MRSTHARTLAALLASTGLLAWGGPLFAYSPWAGHPAVAPFGPFPTHVAVYGPQPAAAFSEAERVAREIERTDRAIASAEGRVQRTGNEKARSDYRNARSRQAEAKDASVQSFYARAARLTLEARAYVKSALIQAGPPENDPTVVGRALTQTDDALGRAREILDGGGTTRLRRTYQVLRDRQEGARRLYKTGAIRGAYAETREVRDGVLDLLRQCADLPVSREMARKALRRAERVMGESKREIGPKGVARAIQLEREAELQLKRARISFARSAYRDALLHAKLVERHLQRAMEARRFATNQDG